MARAIEVPVVVKKGSLSRSIEGEALTAAKRLGGSGSRAVQPLGRMLGKIRADADEFTKSIEASNARVIAFGASVAVINGITRAFRELIISTVKVEKTLADINAVLNITQKGVEKFGDGIFKVARNTAQSFEVAAEAALEFSRQGLGTEETLKRVNDALILTRLTGLKAADSVKGLTAAVNGFGKAGLTTTQIINKLSAVDVKFAVGTDDLIDALSRAGAVAQDAGVSFDDLVAMVTVAQQRTARGGAVIGNAFKTIYTRLQDPRALNTLREVNVAVDDQAGAALSANRVLQNLAQTYDTLTRTQKASVDQHVAGKFQINILKAALGDLGKANSDYARAQQVSANATDQAIRKNEQLNKTSAALAAQTGVTVDQLMSKIGDIAVGPGIKNLLTTVNSLLESMSKGLDGDSMGAKFAKGLLKGIGGVLTGPGLILIGGVFIKLFKDLVVFGGKSLKNLLGLNNAAKQQAAIQQGIGQLLAKNVAYEQAMAAASGNVNKQQAITNSYLAAEVALRQKNATAMAGLAAGAYTGGFRVSGSGSMKRRGIPGFAPANDAIPNLIPLWGKGLSKMLYKPATKSVAGQIGTAKGAAVESLINRYIGQSRGLGSISTKGQGRIAAGADVSGGVFSGYDAKSGGFLKHSGGSPDKGFLRAVAQGGRTMHPWEQMTVKAPGGAKGTGELGGLKKIDYNQGFFDSSSKRYSKTAGMVARGVRPKDYHTREASVERGIPGWLERAKGHGNFGAFMKNSRSHHSAIQSPVSEQNLMENFFRSLGKKVDVRVKGSHFSGSQSKLTRELDDDVYNSIMKALPGDKSQRLEMIQHSMETAQRMESGAMFGRSIPSFSPLSDAIAREKHQVGSLMGISPSSVQTRVVQNAALKSSFNPGGFGVISPTVGQNTFADASKMHRGENLKTTNLPNFAGRRKSRKGAGDALIDDITDMIMGTAKDPTTPYSKKFKEGGMPVYIVGEDAKVTEKRTKTAARAAAAPGSKSFIGPLPPPPTRMQKVKAGASRVGAGLGKFGAAAVNPLLTAAFTAPMVGGFFPGLEGEEKIFSTTAQRRGAGRTGAALEGGIWGGTAAYMAAQGLSMMPGVGKFIGTGAKVGMTALGIGAGAGVGANTDLLNNPFLSSADLKQGAGIISGRTEEKQQKIAELQKILPILQGAEGPITESQRERLMRQAKEVSKTLPTAARKNVESIIGGGTYTSTSVGTPAVPGKRGGLIKGFQPRSARGAEALGLLSQDMGVEGAKRAGQMGARSIYKNLSDMANAGGTFVKGKGVGSGVNKDSKLVMTDSQREQLAMGLADDSALGGKQGKLMGLLGGRTSRTDFINQYAAAYKIPRQDAEKEVGEFAKVMEDDVQLRKEIKKLVEERLKSETTINNQLRVQQIDQKAINERYRELNQSIKSQIIANNQIATGIGLDIPVNRARTQGTMGLMGTFGKARGIAGYAANSQRQEAGNVAFMSSLKNRSGALAQLPDFGTRPGGVGFKEFLLDMSERDDIAPAQLREVAKQFRTPSAGLEGRAAYNYQGVNPATGKTWTAKGEMNVDPKEREKIAKFFELLAQNKENVDTTLDGTKRLITENERLAEILNKNGVLITGVDAFRTGLADAFHQISMNASSASEALSGFGFNLLAAINKRVMSNLADNITSGLFGGMFERMMSVTDKGTIKGQAGMYISSGAPSGDSVPAMLEKGEYVLNRNLVNRIGKKNLDSANFGMVPRLTGGSIGMQTGGVSPFDTASKSVKKELSERFGAGILGTGYSSYSYFKDPQFIRARKLAEEKAAEEAQKRFESQSKKDAMWKMAASTALTMGINAGIGKMANAGKPDAGFSDSQTAYESMLNPAETAAAPRLSWSQRLKAYTKKTWGKQAWKDAFNFSGDKQIGGHIDNIPAMLTAGEYVVGRNAVQKYGTGFLGNINRMQHGGPVGGGAFVQGEGATGGSTAPTTNNNNVSISVNFAKDGGAEVKSVEDSASDDPRKFAGKIREAVMNVINEEKRVGGSLRNRGRRGG